MTLSMNSLLVKEVHNKEIINKETNTEKTSKDNLRFKRLQDFQKGINWDKLVDATFQYYLDSNIGCLIVPTESMLKIYFLQHRYGMLASDMEKALKEVDIFREFALEIDVVPSASSIRAFASLLQENKLSAKIEKAFTVEPMIA